MNFFIKSITYSIFLCLFFSTFERANAQGGGSGPKLLSAGLIVGFGQGKMGNGTTVLDRNMIYTPISVFAGINIKKFRIGGVYEYSMVGQSDDPVSVSNQNLSGKSTGMGVRLDYYDGKQSIGLIYRLSDTLTLDKPTIANDSATYKGKGGMQFQYYRQIKKGFGIVLDYATETYDESVTPNVKWTRMGLGIVLTNFTSSGGR